ncbi:hypothetical protein V6N13_024197 [Hibiscus sabdariffa]
MRGMKRVLKEWNRNSFGNVETQYQKIVDEIEALDARINSEELGSEDLQRKRDLHSRLWAVSKMRESIWRQKSRAIWLAEGDRNTRFFHRQEKIRWVRNRITGLQNNGRWKTTPERLKLLFARELRKHFARVPTAGMFDFNVAFSVLMMTQCKILEVGFTEEEVSGQRHMSHVWRQLVAVQEDVRVQRFMNVTQFLWNLGDGKRILFWHDIWCLDDPLRVVFPRLFRLARNGMAFVRDYMCLSKEDWLGLFCRPLSGDFLGTSPIPINDGFWSSCQ